MCDINSQTITNIAEAVAWGTEQLSETSPTAKLDTEVILCRLLGKQRTYLLAFGDEPLANEILSQFSDHIEQRSQGKPVAYITGVRDFWSFTLRVNEATLIPRPDTELLVEFVLEMKLPAQGIRVLDLGTGSGAIALAIALERPGWEVSAVDISMDALTVAKENADTLQLKNVEFWLSDWFENIPHEKPFDLIVSNPPYIAETDPHLNEGDVRFEPKSALVAADHGLINYRKLISEAKKYFNPDGWLIMEHGYTQGAEIQSMFTEADYSEIDTRQDLSGLDRITFARNAS